MPLLVLTVVGDDRAGLVAALAEVVTAHGGNWERSELAELAGTFAGIVEVSVPAEQSAALTAALGELNGLLKVTAHPASAALTPQWPLLRLTVIGNDHPGIVKEISAALNRHQLSIEHLSSKTMDAPMTGGTLFEASVVARVTPTADLAAIAPTWRNSPPRYWWTCSSADPRYLRRRTKQAHQRLCTSSAQP